jgi:thioredoxin-dependent peroxiredoxin
MIAVGERAPDFELSDGGGKHVRLSQFNGQKNVVLFFYPKDDSPGCTVEACTFRDRYQDFADAGAELIGISSDSVESHAHFAGKHRLPMTLLSDVNGEVRKRYGIKATFGLLPGRATFIVDKSGVVRHVFESQLRVKKHVQESLDILRTL